MGLRHFFKVLKRGFKAFGAKGAAEEAEGLSAKGNAEVSTQLGGDTSSGPDDPDGTDRNAGGEE